MDKIINWLFGLLIILCVIGSFVTLIYLDKQMASDKQKRISVMYDCRIAEISPDVPPAVKQECRKRMEKNNVE